MICDLISDLILLAMLQLSRKEKKEKIHQKIIGQNRLIFCVVVHV